jgi:RNA polymerase sigma-70 factor (ECF subfamily)
LAPSLSFLRRQGIDFDEAEGLTQGLFAHLIETRAYARADSEKGRFRAFLLGALKYFMANAIGRSPGGATVKSQTHFGLLRNLFSIELATGRVPVAAATYGSAGCSIHLSRIFSATVRKIFRSK